MKTLVEICCLMAALGAWAFDSERWLGKREVIAREAERMRESYLKYAGRGETPAEKVVIPFETYPDGSVKTQVEAVRAQYYLKEFFIWAEDMTVKKFDRDGTVTAQIDAKRCLIDRKAKVGWAEGHAKVRYRTTTMEGDDVFFSSPDGYIKVFRNADIVSTDTSFGGLK